MRVQVKGDAVPRCAKMIRYEQRAIYDICSSQYNAKRPVAGLRAGPAAENTAGRGPRPFERPRRTDPPSGLPPPRQQTRTARMKCPECDRELPPHASFCPGCGLRLDRPGGEPPAAVCPPSSAGLQPSPAAVEKLQPAASSLPEDETEVEIWQGTYSPKAMIPIWIGAALLTLIALIGAVAWGLAGLSAWTIFLVAVLLGWGLLFLRLVYLRLNVSYRLTSQRFIHEEGILRRVTDRIEVIDIDDVAFEQGLIDRLTGVGAIRLSSSDRTHSELLLKGIEQVQAVASQIDNARRRERVRRGLHIEAV